MGTHFKLVFFFLSIVGTQVQAQNYLGAGNSSGISVTTSSMYSDTSLWQDTALAINTINGKGLDEKYFSAARLLMQSTNGFEEYHVQELMDVNYNNWITLQFNKPVNYVLPVAEAILQIENDSFVANGGDPVDVDIRPNWSEFEYAWWQINMTNEDLLRHKVASALSEILVISRLSDLSGYGDGLASYYDKLVEHAFGNYRDLIYDVTLHPCMGAYLTHLNNPKTDTVRNIRPDENYAREIMQLFTIGLFELNNNGTRKVVNGAEVPTYNQDDIRELSKVFTGLSVGAVHPDMSGSLYFGMSLYRADVSVPMIMYDIDDPNTMYTDEDQHENGTKYLFGTDTVEADTSGLVEINDALDILFNHPNVGPFLAYRLIQRMVKSNPSPEYVERVALIFNDNGAGVRGDMKAVIRAILMDNEARKCSFQNNHHNSRLKGPLYRYTHVARMMEKDAPLGRYWNINYNFFNDVRQDILASPSVFNFYLPDHQPNGPITDNNLVAPEYKIHDSRTSIAYMNNVHDWSFYGRLMDNWTGFADSEVWWNRTEAEQFARDPEAYINWLDRRYTFGTLSVEYRDYIRTALNGFDQYNMYYNSSRHRAGMGMYLILNTPEYSIIR